MNDEIKKTHPDLEILGQKLYLPNTKIKLIGFIVIILSIMITLIVFICNKYELKNVDGGWILCQSVKLKNNDVNISNLSTIGFWTPSDETEKYLDFSDKEEIGNYSWQTREGQNNKSFDSLNIEFGKIIKNEFDLNGYRRYKVFGTGKGKFKEGWWWNIGLEENCDDKLLKKFKSEYIKFWCPSAKGTEWDKLYIEVIGKSKLE